MKRIWPADKSGCCSSGSLGVLMGGNGMIEVERSSTSFGISLGGKRVRPEADSEMVDGDRW